MKTISEHTGSSDCNIPLAEGIPALAFGTCTGYGIHTREEKLDVSSLPDGTRILLDFLQNSYELEK